MIRGEIGFLVKVERGGHAFVQLVGSLNNSDISDLKE